MSLTLSEQTAALKILILSRSQNTHSDGSNHLSVGAEVTV